MKKKNFIFGIDLGTTNSALAVYMGNQPEIIPVDNEPTFPSVVEYHADGTVTTGREAYKHKGNSNVVYSAKRFMGTDKVYTLTLEDGSTKQVTPVDVASEVLRGIASKASKQYGEIKDVVITVPAYFNHAQREDTLKASKLAGLNCVKIINEPTSASLAYGIQNDNNDEIIVIDIGGGTSDITTVTISNIDKVHPILREVIEQGLSFDINTTGGNNLLGGDDYNKWIYNCAAKDASAQYSVSEDKVKELFPESKWIPMIEEWKLYSSDTVPQETNYTEDGKKCCLTLTSKYLSVAMEEFWNRIKKCIDDCLTIKRINNNGEIQEVSKRRLPQKCLLVGGSTKNQLLRNKIEEYYKLVYKNTKILIPDNSFADYAVALGASVQGAIINGTVNGVQIKEVIPLPIGVENAIETDSGIQNGFFYTMINRDTPIPTSHTEMYTTSYDNQESLRVNVYQGNSNECKYNLYLGTVEVTGIEPAPRGEESIALTFSVDVNGILSVKTIYKGETKSVEIKSILNTESNVFSEKDKQILKKLNICKNFIKSTGKYSDILEAIENWKPGTIPDKSIAEFMKQHKSEIDAHSKSTTSHFN